jgi:hypothetical protein
METEPSMVVSAMPRPLPALYHAISGFETMGSRLSPPSPSRAGAAIPIESRTVGMMSVRLTICFAV